MTTIKKAVASQPWRELMGMTDLEWDEHDRLVRERIDKESRDKSGDSADAVAERLARGGAPAKTVERVWSDRYLSGIPEALLSGFEADERHIRILSGGIGSGKTWGAVRWLGQRGGAVPRFMRANAFEVAGRYDRESRAAWQRCTAMVLDDLGAEYLDGRGNLRSDLDEFIDHFCSANARLIITTNLTPEPFRARYGERIISRLREHCRWKAIKTPDQRSKRTVETI